MEASQTKEDEAARDIARAADGGQPEGHTNLGLMRLFGKEVTKNMATAFRHLKEGVEGIYYPDLLHQN